MNTKLRKHIVNTLVAAGMVLDLGSLFIVEAKAQTPVEMYSALAEEVAGIELIDTADLTEDELSKRNGQLIIERTIGIVLDSEGNGKILNGRDGYDYISYSDVRDVNVGDVVLTYSIYNPDSNYTDDVFARFDYVIDTEQEVNDEID